MKIEQTRFLPALAPLVIGWGFLTPPAALAQEVLPSYKASPKMYTLIGENENFRVIHQVIRPGERDAFHSHLGKTMTYRLSDCTSRVYRPDGTHRDGNRKKGAVTFQDAVPSHSFENTGSTDCEGLIVEIK